MHLKISLKFQFILLFLACLFSPNGLSVIIFPAYLISSNYDPDTAYLPYINLQTLFVLFFISFNSNRLKEISDKKFIRLLTFLILLPLFFGFFAVSYHGYIVFSEALPLVALAFVLLAGSFSNNYDLEKTFSLLPLVASPFFIADLFVSMYLNDFGPFVSISFASNGHSFISYLLTIIIIQCMRANLYVNKRENILALTCAAIYFFGGIISGGKAAFLAFFIAIVLSLKLRNKILLLIFLGASTGLTFWICDYCSTFAFNILDSDYESDPFWSSLRSRMEFWNYFYTMFTDFPIAGYGGLVFNQYKYAYGFPFDVYVDPHNEILHLMLGYGISIFLFFSAFYFAIRRYAYLILRSSRSNVKIYPIYTYLFIAELTNSNFAKPNIFYSSLFILSFCIILLPLKKIKYGLTDQR